MEMPGSKDSRTMVREHLGWDDNAVVIDGQEWALTGSNPSSHEDAWVTLWLANGNNMVGDMIVRTRLWPLGPGFAADVMRFTIEHWVDMETEAKRQQEESANDFTAGGTA